MANERLLSEFGKRIRVLREYEGFTQAQLAARVGVARTSLTNIEAGRQEPGLAVVINLAHALSVSIDTLLDEELAARDPVPWHELARRITSSLREHEALAEKEWNAWKMDMAIRHRGIAEGLEMARNHQLDVIAERRR